MKAGRRPLRGALLLAPLLLLLLGGLVVPMGRFLWNAAAEREVAAILPRTAATLRAWDGEGLPGDDAFAALAEDLRLAPLRDGGTAALARAARRLAEIAPDLRGALPDTARRLSATVVPAAAAVLLSHPAWERPESWAAIRDAAGLAALAHPLAALDLRQGPDGAVRAVPVDEAVHRPSLLRTLRRAGGATFLCVLLGVPLAAVIAASPPVVAAALAAATLLPFLGGEAVRAVGWWFLLRGSAPVPGAAALAAASSFLPVLVLPMVAALRAVPRDLRGIAAVHGASRFRIVRRIIWPALRPALFGGAGAVFALAAGESLAPALLAPGAPALAERIARHAWVAGDLGLAAAAAAVLIVVLAVAGAAAWLLAGRGAR